jgi:hypothetical protein
MIKTVLFHSTLQVSVCAHFITKDGDIIGLYQGNPKNKGVHRYSPIFLTLKRKSNISLGFSKPDEIPITRETKEVTFRVYLSIPKNVILKIDENRKG